MHLSKQHNQGDFVRGEITTSRSFEVFAAAVEAIEQLFEICSSGSVGGQWFVFDKADDISLVAVIVGIGSGGRKEPWFCLKHRSIRGLYSAIYVIK